MACPQPQFAITCSLELLRCRGLSTASSALWSFGIPLKFNHPIALLFLWLPFRTHKQYDVSLQHPSSSSLAFPYHYFNLLSACLSRGPCPSSYFKIIYSRPSLSHSSQATSPALLESWPPSPQVMLSLLVAVYNPCLPALIPSSAIVTLGNAYIFPMTFNLSLIKLYLPMFIIFSVHFLPSILKISRYPPAFCKSTPVLTLSLQPPSASTWTFQGKVVLYSTGPPLKPTGYGLYFPHTLASKFHPLSIHRYSSILVVHAEHDSVKLFSPISTLSVQMLLTDAQSGMSVHSFYPPSRLTVSFLPELLEEPHLGLSWCHSS